MCNIIFPPTRWSHLSNVFSHVWLLFCVATIVVRALRMCAPRANVLPIRLHLRRGPAHKVVGRTLVTGGPLSRVEVGCILISAVRRRRTHT